MNLAGVEKRATVARGVADIEEEVNSGGEDGRRRGGGGAKKVFARGLLFDGLYPSNGRDHGEAQNLGELF